MHISIVVPAYNAARTLSECLGSIRAMEVDWQEIEVIVVDNNSSDDTVAIARRFGFRIEHERDVQTSYAARNRGLAAARGDLIAFTDADCVVDSQWIAMLQRAAAAYPDAGGFAGRIRAYPPSRFIDTYSASVGMLQEDGLLKHPYRPYAQTANFAVRRAVLERIGGFRPELVSGGDGDFCWRMQEAGFGLEHAPDVIVRHMHRQTVAGLWEQHFRYGRGQIALARLHPGFNPIFPEKYSALLHRKHPLVIAVLAMAIAGLDLLGRKDSKVISRILNRTTHTALGAGMLFEREWKAPEVGWRGNP